LGKQATTERVIIKVKSLFISGLISMENNN
jgi:hypothetical protein